jgi:polyhydroxyalkanoate synthesis regulator phasin
MAEPENHTIRALQEFRTEFREFRQESRDNFSAINDRFDSLRQAINGESVLGRYAAAEVEERLAALEKRIGDLEKQR